MKIEIGSLIRNKKPYFGEEVKLIVDADQDQFYTITGPGKHGDLFFYPKHKEIHFNKEIKYYKKASPWIIFYLLLIRKLFLFLDKLKKG